MGGAKGFIDGLEDRHVSLNARPRWRAAYLFNLDVLARYHDFDDRRTGANLGREWNAQVQAAIYPRLSAAIKYADFERVTGVPAGTATPPSNRTKVGFTLEYKPGVSRQPRNRAPSVRWAPKHCTATWVVIVKPE